MVLYRQNFSVVLGRDSELGAAWQGAGQPQSAGGAGAEGVVWGSYREPSP